MLNVKHMISAALAAMLAFAAVPALAMESSSSNNASYETAEEAYDPDAPIPGTPTRQVRSINDLYGENDISLSSSSGSYGIPLLLERFRTETENFSDMIDVSDLDIKLADLDKADDSGYIQSQAAALYELLVFCSPRSYYLLNGAGEYMYYRFPSETRGDGIYLTGIRPYYYIGSYSDNRFDPESITPELREEIEHKQKLLDDEVSYISSFIDDDMTAFDKLLIIQYALNMRYDYAHDELEKPMDERQCNRAVDLIENKKGLCTAISTLYNYIAMENGITDTGFVSSEYSDGSYYHTWNIMKLPVPGGNGEEKWYNIDVTWNETINEGYGLTDLDFFLLSTEETNETHNIFDEGIFAPTEDEVEAALGGETGEEYDDALWHSNMSMMVPYSGEWYFILHRSGSEKPSVIMRYDPKLHGSNGAYTEIYSFEGEWKNGNTVLNRSWSGLGLANGVLYFNTPEKILSYDIATGTAGSEIEVPVREGYSIFSSYVYKNRLYYGISPNYTTTDQRPVEGGSTVITSAAVSPAELTSEGVLSLDISVEPDADGVFVAVKDGPAYRVEHIPAADCSDAGDVSISITLENSSAEAPPVIYVWDDKMRPYISGYSINGVIYRYENGGAVPAADQ